MKQLIQSLHNDNTMPKGFLLDQVTNLLKDKQNLSKLETDLKDLISIKNLNPEALLALKTRLYKLDLLSPGIVNPKTAKTLGMNVSNWILHLTPSNLSGFNICPMASKGCRASCLNGAGRGLFNGVQLPRLRKTLYFIHFRKQFLEHIDYEIQKLEKNAAIEGLRPIVRLNGTSDISFENFKIRDNKSIFELYPNVQFYDYTKVFSRFDRLKEMKLNNYSVTFSASEDNSSHCLKALKLGFNVATVFNIVPETYKGYTTIDGDKHDFRFLDEKSSPGFVVGLKAKGPAKKDLTGFVRVL